MNTNINPKNFGDLVDAWDSVDNKFLDAVIALAELSGVALDDEWGVAKDIIEYAIGVVGGNPPVLEFSY